MFVVRRQDLPALPSIINLHSSSIPVSFHTPDTFHLRLNDTCSSSYKFLIIVEASVEHVDFLHDVAWQCWGGHSWLILTGSPWTTGWMDTTLPNIWINSQLFLLDTNTLKLYEYYRIGKTSSAIQRHIGVYIPRLGFRSSTDQTMYGRRHDLQGHKFTVAYLFRIPYITMEKGKMSGLHTNLLHLLQERLNFTYELYLQPDSQFGVKRKDGTWSGLVGSVLYGKADFSMW